MPLSINSTGGLFFRDYNNPVVPKKESLGMIVLFLIIDIFKPKHSTKNYLTNRNTLLAFCKENIIFTTLIIS